MSVKSARGALAKATRDLHVSWQQTAPHWSDARAQEFEKKYITPLSDALTSSSSIIEELDQLLTKIRRDCE